MGSDQTSPPVRTEGSESSIERFPAIAEWLNAGETEYLRARTLQDGPRKTYIAVVDAWLPRVLATLGHAGALQFAEWASENKVWLKRVSLNVAARLAQIAGKWDTARDLAGEVVARDHHDILAQRIIDAANERRHDLDSEIDRWLVGRTCPAPFRQIETRANGTVHFCCSAWQPVPIGRLEDETGEPFWTSARASEIRRSVIEGDFTHCSRWHCPMIAGRRLPKVPSADVPPKVPSGPSRVILSHDRSCNISCPSCRAELIVADHDRSAKLDRLFDERLLPLLDDATEIKVTGSGDPFGSRHFRYVLKALCARPSSKRRLQLHTNGLLANQRAWNDLGLWGNVLSVWVSVDAARPETYAELRRGGDFAQLKGALDFLGGLRRKGEISALRLDFVVQARNYMEMGEFVDLAREVGADGVYFLRLRNWGHMPPNSFRALDVCDRLHAEHQRLLDVLRDPRLRETGVELGSMSALVQKALRAEPVR